jgi:plastocyanin
LIAPPHLAPAWRRWVASARPLPAYTQGVFVMAVIPTFRTAGRRWRALAALLALGAAQLACGSGQGTPPPPPAGEAADGVVTVNAQLSGFSLSAGSAPAGEVTFNVSNVDPLGIPHDFSITGEGVDKTTARLSGGDSASLTLDLPAGTYTYFCTVEGHQDAGMTGTFIIK